MNEEDIINYITNKHTIINKISENNISKIIELKNFFANNSEQTANFYLNLINYKNNINNSFVLNYFENFNNFYSLHNKILEKIYYFSSQIKSKIIIPLETKIEKKTKEFNEYLNEIEKIKNNMLMYIKDVNTKKEEYYEENKKLNDINFEFIEYIKKQENEKIKISIDNKEKQIPIYENKLSDYENIVSNCNIFAIENEKKFNEIFKKIENDEKDFESFIDEKFKIYYDLINDLSKNINELKEKIYDFNLNINKKYYNNFSDYIKINIKNNVNNWNIFKVVKYEEYLEKKLNNKKDDINNDENNSYFYNPLNEINNNNNNNNYLINDFYSNILLDNKINDESLEKIISLLENEKNLSFYSNFLSNFFSNSKYLNFKEFKSFDNFINFSIILNKILNNLNISENITNESYNIILKIIKISEFAFFNDNQYLCNIIGNNQIFKDKKLWKNLIFNNLINYLIIECNNLLNENDFKIGKKIEKLFNYLSNNNNNNNKIESIIKKNNLSKFLYNYNKLNEENIKLLDEKCINKLIEIIKEFLVHLSDLNINYEFSCIIINELCFDFNIDNKYKNYFLMFLKSCELNIKRSLNNINTTKNNNNNHIKNIIKDFKTQSKEFINNNYPINIINLREKYFILKNVLNYLPKNNKINIMCLNRELQSKISKKLFKKILYVKNTPLNKHIIIWKILLHSQYYKKNFNYENILKKCNEISENEKDIIQKDVERTKFKNDDLENKKKLNNILLCLFYNQNSKKIYYHQGINLLCGFLLEITKNEEETFYLMMGIFEKTKFYEILENDLEKLKCYFKILFKLIYLFLPKIYIQFNKHKIRDNFFTMNYFITLFTYVYSSFKDVENLFLIRTFDDFLLSGWKKILINFLILLKYNQNKIINFDEIQLLDYLSNDLFKSEIFDNNNFEIYLKMKNEFKIINKKIIKDLEEEIKLNIELDGKNNKNNYNK